jgi:hypothetical protein
MSRPNDTLKIARICIINAVYEYWHLPSDLNIESEIMLFNVAGFDIMNSEFDERVIGEGDDYTYNITLDFSPLGWEIIYKYDGVLV